MFNNKLFLLLFLLFLFPARVFAVSCDNFSADFSYEGQRSDSSQAFSDKNNTTVPAGNEFLTKLKIFDKDIKKETEGGDAEIVLVMDRSGSMNAKSKIENAQKALANVVNFFIEENNLNNRLALVTYSSNVTVNQGLTSDYYPMLNYINNMRAAGRTNIGGALETAYELFDLNNDKKKYVILASDGKHNNGTPVDVAIENAPSEITFFTVSFDASDQDVMEEIARAGSGKGAHYSVNIGDLENVFVDIIKKSIILKPENIDINFYRDNYGKFEIKSISEKGVVFDDRIEWLDLSKKAEDMLFDIIHIQKNENQESVAVNKNKILIEYDIGGEKCLEEVDIDVIDIQGVCVPDCSCASSICKGEICSNGCGGTCLGEIICPPGGRCKNINKQCVGNVYQERGKWYKNICSNGLCGEVNLDLFDVVCGNSMTDIDCGVQTCENSCRYKFCKSLTEIGEITEGEGFFCDVSAEGCVNKKNNDCYNEKDKTIETCSAGYICVEVGGSQCNNHPNVGCVPKTSNWTEI